MISYEPLYRLLKDKDISMQEVSLAIGFSKASLASSISRNESLSTVALDKICAYLNCGLSDVFEIVPDGTVIEHKRTCSMKNRKMPFTSIVVNWPKLEEDIKKAGYSNNSISTAIGKPNFVARKKQHDKITIESLKLITDFLNLNADDYIQ